MQTLHSHSSSTALVVVRSPRPVHPATPADLKPSAPRPRLPQAQLELITPFGTISFDEIDEYTDQEIERLHQWIIVELAKSERNLCGLNITARQVVSELNDEEFERVTTGQAEPPILVRCKNTAYRRRILYQFLRRLKHFGTERRLLNNYRRLASELLGPEKELELLRSAVSVTEKLPTMPEVLQELGMDPQWHHASL